VEQVEMDKPHPLLLQQKLEQQIEVVVVEA
jgi:hypothetical protein